MNEHKPCDCNGCFDPARNLSLAALKAAWNPGPMDLPSVRADFLPDGVRFRVRTATEVLDELIAECRGEVE